MKTKTIMITWITAIAIGLTIAGPINANERGDRGGRDRGAKVIINHPGPVYDDFRTRNSPVIIRENRGNQYAYGRPHHATKKVMKAKKRQKMRKLRRMRRIAHNNDHMYERQYERRYEPRYEPRYETRYEPRYQTRNQPYYDRPVIIIPVPFL